MATAVKVASNALATPDIKSPDIRSLNPFIKETPGSRGIIEPTIRVLGWLKNPILDKEVPITAINIAEVNVANEGIELILNILSNIITAKIDVINVKMKSTNVHPNKTEKQAEPSPVPT